MHVAAGVTAQFLVMDLELLPAATILAAPGVALEDLQTQLLVSSGIKFDTRSLR